MDVEGAARGGRPELVGLIHKDLDPTCLVGIGKRRGNVGSGLKNLSHGSLVGLTMTNDNQTKGAGSRCRRGNLQKQAQLTSSHTNGASAPRVDCETLRDGWRRNPLHEGGGRRCSSCGVDVLGLGVQAKLDLEPLHSGSTERVNEFAACNLQCGLGGLGALLGGFVVWSWRLRGAIGPARPFHPRSALSAHASSLRCGLVLFRPSRALGGLLQGENGTE